MDRPNPYLRVHAVNVYVRDQDRSLRFYVDQLGFDLAFDVRLQSGGRWVAVAPPDGTAVLTLIAPEPGSKEYQLIGRQTEVVFLSEDVTAKFREWSQRGGPLSTYSAPEAPQVRQGLHRRIGAAGRAAAGLGRSVHTLQRY